MGLTDTHIRTLTVLPFHPFYNALRDTFFSPFIQPFMSESKLIVQQTSARSENIYFGLYWGEEVSIHHSVNPNMSPGCW